jgi:hypothetical protein
MRLRVPDIALSGVRLSCSHIGYYSPKDNEIRLTHGLYLTNILDGQVEHAKDEAEQYIWALNHELTHWASFLFLSSMERARVLRDYTMRQGWAAEQTWDADHGMHDPGQGETYILLEAIAYYVSGVR